MAEEETVALRAEVENLRHRIKEIGAAAVEAQARFAFLADASMALGASLDVDTTLGTLGHLAVPRVADWCAVHLAEEDGSLRLVAVHHLDPAKVALGRKLLGGDPLRSDDFSVLGVAVRSGQVTFRPTFGPDMAGETGDSYLDALRQVGPESVLVVGLTARDRHLGALTLLTEEGRTLGRTDVGLAEELAWRGALALDNARLHEQTERPHARLAYQATMRKSQAEAGLDGLLVVSPKGEVIEFNHRFAEIWGLPDEMLGGGADVLDLAAAQVADPVAFMTQVRETYAHPDHPTRDEIALGDGRVLDRYGAPLLDDAGAYHGWAWYFRDVTEQKRWEKALFESGERFAALARTLQQSLLPPSLPEVPGLEMAVRYHPARGGLELGGDFYDVFQKGRRAWAIVMGDVCGKGADAARTTGLARYTLRAAAMQAKWPSNVLAVLNEALLRQASLERGDGDPQFVTALYATVRPTGAHGRIRLVLSLGGHPRPLVLRSNGRVEAIGEHGTALGLVREVTLTNREATLREGDAVVFFTDGVTEARGPTGEFGEAGLHAVLGGLAHARAAEIATSIEASVLDHQGGEGTDDLAVLVLKVVVPSSDN